MSDKMEELIEMSWENFVKYQENRCGSDRIVYGKREGKHKVVFSFSVFTFGQEDDSKIVLGGIKCSQQ